MKYCENCFAQLEDDALFCTECGTPTVKGYNTSTINTSQNIERIEIVKEKKNNGLGIASIIISIVGIVFLFFGKVGLFLGGIGFLLGILGLIFLRDAKRGLAIAGTIISGLILGIGLFILGINADNGKQLIDFVDIEQIVERDNTLVGETLYDSDSISNDEPIVNDIENVEKETIEQMQNDSEVFEENINQEDIISEDAIEQTQDEELIIDKPVVNETKKSKTVIVVIPTGINANVVKKNRYIGDSLSASDFTIMINMSDGTSITNPEGWEAEPLVLNGKSNDVKVSYEGLTTIVNVSAKEREPEPTKETVIVTKETPSVDTGTSYSWVLNTNTKKVHFKECSSVSQMKEKNKKISNQSPEELQRQGYSACGRCHPF